MSIADLFAELAFAPRLDGALCRGKADIWDMPPPPTRDPDPDDTAQRITFAIGACQRCPALSRCRAWVSGLRPSQRPAGVVAGELCEPGIDPPDPGPPELDHDAASITSRIQAFVNGRSLTEAADLAAIGIDRSRACTILHRLARVGRIERVGRGRYAAATGRRSQGVHSCGRMTARKRPCRNEVESAGRPCDFHRDRSDSQHQPDEGAPMTNSPISAALDLIRSAKRTGDDVVSAESAVQLAATGLDAEQLRSVLRLLFPFMAELYLVKRLSKEALDRQDAQTFAELAATLGDLDPDAYDSDPVGDIWRAGQACDTGQDGQ